jgi:protein O-GlcNAc transferase
MTDREQVLSRASLALSQGRPEAAETDLRIYLTNHSQDVDARFYFAQSLAAKDNLAGALEEYQRLLSIRPGHWPAITEMSITWSVMGNPRRGMAVLESVQGLDANRPELHYARGLSHLGLGSLAQAEASFRSAAARGLRTPQVYDQLGATLFRMQRYPEAVNSFQQAVTLDPQFGSAWANLGDALIRLGDGERAVRAYQEAVSLQPDDALTHAALGTALLYTGQPQAATVSLERALALNPQLADMAVNLGTARRQLNLDDRAADAFAHALVINPVNPDALLGLGLLTADRGDSQAAVRLLRAALDQRPGSAEMALVVAEKLDLLDHRNESLAVYEQAARTVPDPEISDAHGRLLHRLGRHQDALARYARALELDPTRRVTQLNRAHALESLGAISEAIDCFYQALHANAADADAIAGLASCAVRICDWALAQTMLAKLLANPTGMDQLHPFLRFALDLDPAVLAASSRRTALAIAARTPETRIEFAAQDRLRIAYLSPDFRQHPVAYSIAGVIKRHDRERHEVLGVALAAPDDSAIATELKASFDEFLDCSTAGNQAIVELLRRRKIDIAIDLGGFTAGARPEVFAARIAPLQLNYLGFAGSTGARYMDFMLADDTVVPQVDEHLYAEKILRMPHSYLPFDRDRRIARQPSRAEAGLPDEGFVFCAFSNGYKISREMFEVWMRLLKEVPASVLWLRSGAALMQANLIRTAQAHGISIERLVFAGLLPQMEDHLGRLQCADLFLDTCPYNAHTTAAEALWAGVPVITCRGRSFAGRVGASLLAAAQLPELICEHPEEYFACALRLAHSPAALAELKVRLRRSNEQAPLFDTMRYVRDLEALLRSVRSRDEHSQDCNIR